MAERILHKKVAALALKLKAKKIDLQLDFGGSRMAFEEGNDQEIWSKRVR